MKSVGVVACVVLGVLAGAAVAGANGGPVQWHSAASARGNVAPLRVDDVRLLSEDLRIALEEDGEHYRVQATYVLSNPGGARRLRYGVPLAWGMAAPGDGEINNHHDWLNDEGPRIAELRPAGAERRLLESAATSIRIRLGGRSYGCALETGARRAVKAARRIVRFPSYVPSTPLCGLRPGSSCDQGPWPEDPLRTWGRNAPSEVGALDISEAFEVETWCVATVVLPRGPSVPLTLSYRGVLEHWSDWEPGSEYYRYPQLRSFAPRYLRYALFPAGSWAGPAKQLTITVDPGSFRGLVGARQPEGSRLDDDGKLVWELGEVDLRKTPALVVRVDPRPVLRRRELARWNHRQRQASHLTLSARASSQLVSRRGLAHDAAKAIDGDPGTAWCARTRGDGQGQWIELRLRRPPRLTRWAREEPGPKQACDLQGLVLVAGEQGRVRRVRVEGCGGGPGFEATLSSSDNRAGAPVMLWLGTEDWHEDNPFDYGRRGRQDSSAEQVRLGTLTVKDRDPTLGKLLERWADPRTACLRLTILEAAPGESGHVCLSETAPVLRCP